MRMYMYGVLPSRNNGIVAHCCTTLQDHVIVSIPPECALYKAVSKLYSGKCFGRVQ